jgi:hypothetical protein
VQELERLEARATRKRNQWHDIRSGKIRFATETEKLVHLEGTWIRWKQAVADLNAYKNNGAPVSSSPKQGEVIRIAIRELTPPRSVPSHM